MHWRVMKPRRNWLSDASRMTGAVMFARLYGWLHRCSCLERIRKPAPRAGRGGAEIIAGRRLRLSRANPAIVARDGGRLPFNVRLAPQRPAARSARTDSPDGPGLAFSPRRGRAEVSTIPCAKIRNSRGISTLIPLSSPRAKNVLLPFYRKM